MRSADEYVTLGRRQPRETRFTSDGRLSSPETNSKVGRLPLFFMQLFLSHMFLSFMVRTSLRTVSCSPSAFNALSHSLSQCWHDFCHAGGDRQIKSLTPTFTQARPSGAKNIGAKMTSRSCKKFPVRIMRSKTRQTHAFSLLDYDWCRFEPKKYDFEPLFNFQGPVISGCTIVLTETMEMLISEGSDSR